MSATAEKDVLRETFIPLHLVCRWVGRTAQTLRNDARAGLLTITHQKGVRSPLVRADRLNSYIRRKHFGKVPPLTDEALERLQPKTRVAGEWCSSLHHDAAHFIVEGKALCTAAIPHGNRWIPNGDHRRCTRCMGALNKKEGGL